MDSLNLRKITYALWCIFFITQLQAQNTETWSGAISNFWDTPLNWDPGNVPDGANDTAIFDITPSTPQLYSNTTLGYINTTATGTLNLGTYPAGSLTVPNNDLVLTADGDTTIQAPIDISLGGTLRINPANTKIVLFSTGATLGGQGDLAIGGNAGGSVQTQIDLTYSGTTEIGTNTTFSFENPSLSCSSSTVTNNGTLSAFETNFNGAIINSGTIEVRANVPGGVGLSCASLTNNANGTLKEFITNPGNAHTTNVTGTATLAGNLEVEITAGAFQEGDEITMLTANQIVNRFDSLTENSALDLTLRYTNTSVILLVQADGVVSPIPISSLPTNTRSVGNYFLEDTAVTFGTQDLTNVANTTLALTDRTEFENALIRLTPLPFSAHPQLSLQKGVQMAVVLDKQFQQKMQSKSKKTRIKKDVLKNDTRLWKTLFAMACHKQVSLSSLLGYFIIKKPRKALFLIKAKFHLNHIPTELGWVGNKYLTSSLSLNMELDIPIPI